MWVTNGKTWYSQQEFDELKEKYDNTVKQYNSLLEQYNKLWGIITKENIKQN
jgi:hypothetical protein